jgi:hypothetical protein
VMISLHDDVGFNYNPLFLWTVEVIKDIIIFKKLYN